MKLELCEPQLSDFVATGAPLSMKSPWEFPMKPVSRSCYATEAVKAKPSAPEVATVGMGCTEGIEGIAGILGDHSSFSFARPWPTWEPEASWVFFDGFLGEVASVAVGFFGEKKTVLCFKSDGC